MTDDYSDIINLPHHVSPNHPRMPMDARAAQFAPFAALTGYDAAIRETGRLTDEQVWLSDDDYQILNQKFAVLMSNEDGHPQITVTYFKPDERKSGGAYLSVTGALGKIDLHQQMMTLTDGIVIPFAHIMDILLPDMLDAGEE